MKAEKHGEYKKSHKSLDKVLAVVYNTHSAYACGKKMKR